MPLLVSAMLVVTGVVGCGASNQATTQHSAGAASTCADGGTCVVGDTGPGGGTVIYVAATTFTSPGSTCGDSCHYLEAAPKDLAAISWCSSKSTLIPGTFGVEIGTGFANTELMLSGGWYGCIHGAGYIARNYSNNGKTDWFLPSKDELNAAYAAHARGIGGFAADYYWSSTQCNATNAWVQNFPNGKQLTDVKGAARRVRPVRAF